MTAHVLAGRRRKCRLVLGRKGTIISTIEPQRIRMLERRDNYDTQSLLGFLRMLQERHPEALLRVRDPVDLRLAMTAVVFELDRAGRDPVVFFENVVGPKMPVVTNIAASRKLLADCLGVAPADLAAAFRERCQ